jgi:putative tricarboxylic transport membrane protein
MFLFGLLGFFFLRVKMASAPFLIGFILGPMLEDNLRRTVLIGKGDPMIFFRGPITWIFIGLTIGSLIFAIRRWQSQRSGNTLSQS